MQNKKLSAVAEQKRDDLAKRLFALRLVWPYCERNDWSIKNAYNADTIRKLYLSGTINSIPVAEKILEAIEEYMKANNIAA